MEDNQKKYLDKVISLLVRDSIIDYDKAEIHLPFFKDPFYLSNIHFFTPSHLPPTVYRYCKNTYGIDGDEIEYVWDQYSVTIKEKI
mgnify:FL=1